MASGSSKNMTFTRRKSGKVIIGRRRKPSDKPVSEDRLKIRVKFNRGIEYAKTAMDIPERKALYDTKVGFDQSAYILAVRDYYKAPTVDSIDASAYTGLAGETIRILATDDFKVIALKVSIRSAAGAVLESGNAVLHPNGVDWVYTATVANQPLAGSKIVATAYDLPDNSGTLEITL